MPIELAERYGPVLVTECNGRPGRITLMLSYDGIVDPRSPQYVGVIVKYPDSRHWTLLGVGSPNGRGGIEARFGHRDGAVQAGVRFAASLRKQAELSLTRAGLLRRPPAGTTCPGPGL